MDDAEGRGELAALADVREQLLSELAKLMDKRKSLEVQMEALGEELKGVDVEVEATRRMLELVEATEQQLAGQGQEELHESEARDVPVEAGTEVRVGAPAQATVLPLTPVSLRQPTPAAALKRSCPSSPDVEPQPLPARALPAALWEDHLLPLLTCKDAARLACTCKALRGEVREHFTGICTLDSIKTLRAALTTFPRARSLELEGDGVEWEDGEKEALLQWLREGGRGRHLLGLTEDALFMISDVFHEALQEGAPPSLRRVDVDLPDETHRASLTGGFLEAMHELRLSVHCKRTYFEVEPQLAALGLVRHLPALTKLELEVYHGEGDPVQWPPFIPTSLKALRMELQEFDDPFELDPLLSVLPGMLEASEAGLNRLEIIIPHICECLNDGLVHLAEALRYCSSTLKGCLLTTGYYDALRVYQAPDEDGYDTLVEQLREQWADLLAGVSACRELQVLVLPNIKMEPLFPPGTAFGRLIHLEICDHEREHPPDAGMVGLWELMASGGLPALAKLSVRLKGRGWRVEDVRHRMMPALEAVAGTLTHLHLEKPVPDQERDEEVDVGYELGVAVGKLWRLKDLALELSQDGRVYDAFAQGLAASGGERPLPLLWRVWLPGGVKANADLLASLLLPTVGVFISATPTADRPC
jgi:hypothetical protein